MGPAAKPLPWIRGARKPTLAGFTLTEMMISATILLLVVAGVLTFFVSFSKAGVRMGFYSESEFQNQKLYQMISQDVRDAEEIEWIHDEKFTLTIKGTEITYTYEGGTLTRQETGAQPHTIARNLSEFEFHAYDANGNTINLSQNLSGASADTKSIGFSGRTVRSHSSVADSSSKIQSALYMMRNKSNPAP